MQKLYFITLLLILALGAGLGCASKDIADANTPDGAFKIAEELDKDERYEEALTKYNDVKNKHPYSKFAVEAELKIADVHYKRENYLEAQTAYQLFKDFHPKHSRIDYVTFRLAMSFYNQLPSTIDRDLSPAFKAIQYFDEVMASYSKSEFVNESKEKKQSSLKMLAEKEAYIGNFYFIRDMYDSSLKRYEGLYQKYPGLGLDEEALYRIGYCAYETNQPDLAKKYLNELLTKFPNSSYADKGKGLLADHGNR